MAPKLPSSPPSESYFIVISAPFVDASTVSCVTVHGTMPLPPPYEAFIAVARALTSFASTPTTRIK